MSVPAELDREIEMAASREGLSYSAWLAEAARKELKARAGLAAVAQFERSNGPFSKEELAEAEGWVKKTLEKGRRSGSPRRRSA